MVKSVEEICAELKKFSESSPLIEIVSALGSDAKLHLVGGLVRDVALGKISIDIDIATILKPEVVQVRLSAKNIKTFPTGIEHGTVLAVVDEQHIEITTFRKPAAREETQAKGLYSQTIEEDLQGRDFTINALAFAIHTGALVDPSSGLQDLQSRIIRAVDNPKLRFSEDPLRILRMIRFGQAQNFSVEESTWNAAEVLADQLQKVSIERVQAEFAKIMLGINPVAGVRALLKLKILDWLLPEILPSVGFEQNDFHTEDVFEHTMSVLGGTQAELTLRLAALFHDTGKPATLSTGDDGRRHFYEHELVSEKITRAALQRWRFPSDVTERVAKIVRYHMRPLECGPSAIRRLLRDLDADFETWRALKIADKTPTQDKTSFNQQLAAFDALVAHEQEKSAQAILGKLAIDGYDLMQLGFKAGPEMGAVIDKLKEKVLDHPEINNREQLLELAKTFLA